MKNFKHAKSHAHQVSSPLRTLLLGGASALAVAVLIGPAIAQETGQIETVVVTGRREAMQSAQDIKQNANQIVDAIVADDAGKLPDNSITEVLQRVSGVTITRFAAPSDPDHYSIEGSGVAVRGLTQVNSTLNGRQDFSANGGRALLWQDVPPELMKSVEVYKSSTADQIEGGIGGSVNLRTHMPFDFDKETFNGSLGANYGDFVKQGRPAGSALYSNTWETGIGKIGFLVDLAYSDITSRFDTYQMEPYYQQTLNTSGATTGAVTAYLPGGFDWRIGNFQRHRLGEYEAVEWEPIESLRIYQTFFQSYYDQVYKGPALYNAQDASTGITTGSTYVLDANNHVVQASSEIQVGGWAPYPCYTTPPATPAGATCSSMNSDIASSKTGNRTTDFTEGFDWNPTDKLAVSGAFQYVHATGYVSNMDIDSMSNISSFAFDTRGNIPKVVLGATDQAQVADPADSIWWYTMDHIENHIGNQLSGNIDAKYTVSEVPVLRAFRFGVRYANMTERDLSSDYHWNALTPPWSSPWKYLNTANTGDTTTENWNNFFRGSTTQPPPMIMASQALVDQFNNLLYHVRYGEPGDTTGAVTYAPSNITVGNTKTKAVYLMADFGVDDVFGMPMDGNIGLRVVNNSNTSVGSERQPYISAMFIYPDLVTEYNNYDAGETPSVGGYHYTKVLPSLNFQLMPTSNTHLRFAASQSLTNPTFNQLSASGGISLNLCPGNIFDLSNASSCRAPGSPIATGWGGNPWLKPQVSNNVDMSFEWYGENQSAAHVAVFYKNINNYLEYSSSYTNKPLALPNGTIATVPVQMSIYYNESSPAIVRGFEAGFTKFFDFLPSPFDGLGVDANFTYIDSRNPSALSCQLIPSSDPSLTTNCNGNIAITGLPVEGLSKFNYNLTAMYEKGPWSVRVAYDWRSTYLLVSSGANGTHTLPVFSRPYGQMDFGASYKIDDHFTIGVDGQNILNTVTKTVMGVKYDRADPAIGNQQYGRNWFMSDRRVIGSIRFAF